MLPEEDWTDIQKAAQALGRRGGQSKSEKKRKASAENGRKSKGRPKKESEVKGD